MVLQNYTLFPRMTLVLERAEALEVRDPSADRAAVVGPVINKRSFDRINGIIETGVANGEQRILGGNRPRDDGYFIAPTLFENVYAASPFGQEEIFGRGQNQHR